jgi:hypothetical protein
VEWLPQASIRGTVEARRIRWVVLRDGVVMLQFEGEVNGNDARGRYMIGAGVAGTWTARRVRPASAP